jgi:hypothetical protein
MSRLICPFTAKIGYKTISSALRAIESLIVDGTFYGSVDVFPCWACAQWHFGRARMNGVRRTASLRDGAFQVGVCPMAQNRTRKESYFRELYT